MKSLKFSGLITLIVLYFFSLKTAQAQVPMVYGITIDKGESKRISAVTPGGPGDKAGILPGDVITAVNGVKTTIVTTDGLLKVLAKQASVSLTIIRGGEIKAFSLSKAPKDSFGRSCLSGNCQTGTGRLQMAGYGNQVYEGQFENGTPKGEFKVYDEHSALLYKGSCGILCRTVMGKPTIRTTTGPM